MSFFLQWWLFIRENRRALLLWGCVVVLTIFPAVFFPHSFDLAVFLRVVSSLQSGGVLYHDIVEIKPPLVYDVVRLFSALGGTSEVGFHLVDSLYLLLALFVSVYLLYIATKNITVALLSTWFMALTYVSNGFAVVVQSESLALLPFVLFVYVVLRDQERVGITYGFVIGAIVAVLTGLKLTLGAAVLVVAVLDISERLNAGNRYARKWLGVISGMVCVSLIVWRTLLNPLSLEGYTLVMSFTKSYAAIPAINGEWIRTAWKSVIVLLFDRYSFTLSLLAIVGFVVLFIAEDRQRKIMRVMTLLFSVMLLTIVLERKFFGYHFFRLVVPLSILSAFGAIELRNRLRTWWKQGKERVILSLVVFILIVWSPLARLVSITEPTVSAFFYRGPDGVINEQRVVANLYRDEESMICDSIRRHNPTDEHVAVVAMNSPRIAMLLGESGKSFVAGSHFALADYAPPEWQQRFADEMRRARWLVVGTGDSIELFNKPPTNSIDIISRREPFLSVFGAFDSRWQTEHFVVYERKSVANPTTTQ